METTSGFDMNRFLLRHGRSPDVALASSGLRRVGIWEAGAAMEADIVFAPHRISLDPSSAAATAAAA
jgi:hypothetical protein